MQHKSKQYGLVKAERITSEKQIEQLFKQGKRKYFGTLALSWLITPSDKLLLPQILISAPKKQFKKAVDRNRIKRMIREAYRLQKSELVRLAAEKQTKIQMAVVYTGKELPDYHQIEKKLKDIIAWMLKQLV